MDGGYGTGKDVALYMGVSEPSVWRLSRRGRLKSYRLASLRLVRFKRADCDEFMTAHPAFAERSIKGVRHGR
jgi:excisionase family DNA binding protein